ncbi:MAG: hypothetical protein KGZ60_14240 [Truepera sp.]|nr:hypothetical protein [Truepera sp.]
MLFRRRQVDARYDGWVALARRLELDDAGGHEALLLELLNPPGGSRLAPIYTVQLDTAQLYLTDCREDGRSPALTSAVLISTTEPIAPAGLRASRKLNPVLESLGASASGGQRVVVPQDAVFNQRVSVLARNAVSALAVLTPPLRRKLLAALYDHQAAPTFLLSEQHLVLTVKAPADQPTELAQLEALAVDLLGIYAAIKALRQTALG